MIKINGAISILWIQRSLELIIDLTFLNLPHFGIHRSFELITHFRICCFYIFITYLLQYYPILTYNKTSTGNRIKTIQIHFILRTYVRKWFVVRIISPPNPFPHIHADKKTHPDSNQNNPNPLYCTYVCMCEHYHLKVWVCYGHGSKIGKFILIWNVKS